MDKLMKMAAGGLLALGLVGCSNFSANVSTALTDLGLGATDLSDVCSAAAPLVPAAATAAAVALNTPAGNLGSNINAVCTASGGVATVLDPSGQPVTPAWLESIITAFEDAVKLAPLVLPLL